MVILAMLSYNLPHYYLSFFPNRILYPDSYQDALLAFLSVFLLLTLIFATFRLVTRFVHSASFNDTQIAKIQVNRSARAGPVSRKGVKARRKGAARLVQNERQSRGQPAHPSSLSRDTSVASTATSTSSATTSTSTTSSAQTVEQEQDSGIEPERKSFFASLYAMIATTLPRAVQLPLPDLATLTLSSDRVPVAPTSAAPAPPHTSSPAPHTTSETPVLNLPEVPWPVKQPYDAFLVLDVEATCKEGTDFNWPNEIIVSFRVLLICSFPAPFSPFALWGPLRRVCWGICHVAHATSVL